MVFLPNDTNRSSIHSKVIENFQLEIEDNVVKSTEKSTNYNVKRIFDLLCDNPDHVTQIDVESERKITFREMKDQSVSLALWLKKQGVKPGDVVALCSPDHLNIYNVILATMFVEAIYSPWSTDVELELARHYMRLTQPKVLFANEKHVALLNKAAEIENHEVQIVTFDKVDGFLHINDIFKLQTGNEVDNFKLSENANPETIALICCTSGTTGMPKGVASTIQSTLRRIFSFAFENETPNRVSLEYLHPCWDVHMYNFFMGLVTKTTQIFHRNFSVIETPTIIQDYKVEYLYAKYHSVAVLVETCVKNNCILESVKKVLGVGTKMHPKIEDKIHRYMPNAYIFKSMGTTETGQITNNRKKCKNPLSTGTVSREVQIKIKNFNTREKLGSNNTGELYVKTPCMMKCYYKDPEKTAAALDEEGFYQTGDEAYYDENGELIVIGRLKEIIKYRLLWVQPVIIELLFKNHPEVSDAAIVGIPHPIDGQRGVAFLETASNVSEEEFLQMISHLKLQDFLKDLIYFVEKLPRNVNGKIDKRTLEKLAIEKTKSLKEI